MGGATSTKEVPTKNSHEFPLDFGSLKVPTILDSNLKDRTEREIKRLNPDQVLVVSDEIVWSLYSSYFNNIENVSVKLVPNGDKCKEWSILQSLAEWSFEKQATKSTIIVGFGGGAVLNLTGLVAALLFRGLKLVYIPTTFLAAHDVVSSLKTAICFDGRKNNIGTYYPSTVNIIDVDFFKSLPAEEILSGLGELVKNALCLGSDHVDILTKELERCKDKSLSELNFMVLTQLGLNAKMSVLKNDSKEKNQGMIFEYGHTLGHALEKAYLQHNIILPHGIGVAYGMRFCSYISVKHGHMSKDVQAEHDRLCELVCERWPLPDPLPCSKILQDLALRDSKRGVISPKEESDEVCEVLLNKISEPRQSKTMLHKFKVQLIDEFWSHESASFQTRI